MVIPLLANQGVTPMAKLLAFIKVGVSIGYTRTNHCIKTFGTMRGSRLWALHGKFYGNSIIITAYMI